MKILQFGEGNFLRAYFDWMLQKMADATGETFEVILVQPRDGDHSAAVAIAKQGSFHVLLRGYEGDIYRETVDTVRVITDGVNPYRDTETFLRLGLSPDMRVVVSNTTEAGIAYEPGHNTPHNFPSMLALLLHKRAESGLDPVWLLPTELIEHNADHLKACVLAYGKDAGYGEAFVDYVNRCPACNTLVDRIVPGFPADAAERLAAEIGHDPYLTSGELFHLLVLEGSEDILRVLPFDKAGLNVVVTPDKLPFYRERKVRLLNGAHTASVPVALFAGVEAVHSFTESHAAWLRDLMHNELAFALARSEDSPEADSPETHAYADEVLNRFRNPALNHKFRSIALNSIAKTNSRLRASLEDYWGKAGRIPPRMTEALHAMIRLYTAPSGTQTLPGGPLDLSDFADLKGAQTPESILECLMPGLDPALKKAVLA